MQKNANEASRIHGTKNIGGFFISGGYMFNISTRHRPSPAQAQPNPALARPRPSPVQPRPSPGPFRPSPGPAQAWPRPGLEIWKFGIQNCLKNSNLKIKIRVIPTCCQLFCFMFVWLQERRATTFHPWDRGRRS